MFTDEPTRSLDPIPALRLRRFVADVVVGELGARARLPPHSMPEAETLCDRLAFIDATVKSMVFGSVAELRRTIGYGTRCELRLGEASGDVTELDPRGAGIASVAICSTARETEATAHSRSGRR